MIIIWIPQDSDIQQLKPSRYGQENPFWKYFARHNSSTGGNLWLTSFSRALTTAKEQGCFCQLYLELSGVALGLMWFLSFLLVWRTLKQYVWILLVKMFNFIWWKLYYTVVQNINYISDTCIVAPYETYDFVETCFWWSVSKYFSSKC